MTTSGAHLLVVLVVDLSSSVGVGFSVLAGTGDLIPSDLTGGAGLLGLAGTVCKCVCVTRTYVYRKINTHLRQFTSLFSCFMLYYTTHAQLSRQGLYQLFYQDTVIHIHIHCANVQ